MKCYTIFAKEAFIEKDESVAGKVINVLVLFLNIVTNSSLIYAILKLKLTRKPTFVFYLFMGINDPLIAIVLQPLVGYVSSQNINMCTPLDVVGQVLAHSLCQFSGLMMTFIAFDRYLHMKLLTNYNYSMNNKKAYTLVFVAFVLCLLIAASSALSSIYRFVFTFQAVLTAINIIVLLAVFVAYVRTFHYLRVHIFADATGVITRADIKVAKYIILLLITMIVCYVPNFISLLVWLYQKYHSSLSPNKFAVMVLGFSSTMVVANSFINSILLVLSNLQLRQFFRFKLCRREQPVNGVPTRSHITITKSLPVLRNNESAN